MSKQAENDEKAAALTDKEAPDDEKEEEGLEEPPPLRGEDRVTPAELYRLRLEVPQYVTEKRKFITFKQMKWDEKMRLGQVRLLLPDRKQACIAQVTAIPRRKALEDILLVDNNGM